MITQSGLSPHCRPSWKSRREEGREGYKGAGAGRMTSEDRDYEASIRHALHATAESIDPAGDGLERIRHRVASPRPATSLLSSLVAWFRRAAIKLLVRLEPGAWLWPVLAIAGAAAIMIAGIFALSEVQQSITQANSVSPPGTSHHPVRASPPTQMALGAWALPIGVEPSPTTGSRSGQSSTVVLPVRTPPTASAPPHTRSTPAPTATDAHRDRHADAHRDQHANRHPDAHRDQHADRHADAHRDQDADHSARTDRACRTRMRERITGPETRTTP